MQGTGDTKDKDKRVPALKELTIYIDKYSARKWKKEKIERNQDRFQSWILKEDKDSEM